MRGFTLFIGFMVGAMFSVLAEDCLDLDQYVPNANCPGVYMPVCGCDGRTYGNACEATAAGVKTTTAGPCVAACYEPDSIDNNVNCPLVIDPVCGCNGITYGNGCEARYYGGVLEYVSGGCPDGCRDTSLIDTTIVCQTVYDPVCGCDSVTYDNSCIALYQYGVPVTTPGPCPLYWCKDFTTIDSTANCVPTVQEVCGCDGVTYINACTAEKYNGVQSWTAGACPDTNTTVPIIEALQSIKLYPNPAQNVLWVDAGELTEGTLYLTDITGKLLLTRSIDGVGAMQVDITNMETGLYLVTLYSEGKVFHTKVQVLR